MSGRKAKATKSKRAAAPAEPLRDFFRYPIDFGLEHESQLNHAITELLRNRPTEALYVMRKVADSLGDFRRNQEEARLRGDQ